VEALTFILLEMYNEFIIFVGVRIMNHHFSMIHRVFSGVDQSQVRVQVPMRHALLDGLVLTIIIKGWLSLKVLEDFPLCIVENDVLDDEVVKGFFLEAIQHFCIDLCHVLDDVEVPTAGHGRFFYQLSTHTVTDSEGVELGIPRIFFDQINNLLCISNSAICQQENVPLPQKPC